MVLQGIGTYLCQCVTCFGVCAASALSPSLMQRWRHTTYPTLIGILRWIVELGRVDIIVLWFLWCQHVNAPCTSPPGPFQMAMSFHVVSPGPWSRCYSCRIVALRLCCENISTKQAMVWNRTVYIVSWEVSLARVISVPGLQATKELGRLSLSQSRVLSRRPKRGAHLSFFIPSCQ